MSDAGATTKDIGPDEIEGGHLKPVNTLEILGALPESEKLKFAQAVIDVTPEGQKAASKKRRDRFRIALTVIVVIGIIAEAFVALYLTQIKGSISWSTMKDWLTLAIAPLAAIVGGMVAFWFPSKESA
jgi:hypothetical protein